MFNVILLHLDNCIRETVDEYKKYVAKSLHPRVLIRWARLPTEDGPVIIDPFGCEETEVPSILSLSFNYTQHGSDLIYRTRFH